MKYISWPSIYRCKSAIHAIPVHVGYYRDQFPSSITVTENRASHSCSSISIYLSPQSFSNKDQSEQTRRWKDRQDVSSLMQRSTSLLSKDSREGRQGESELTSAGSFPTFFSLLPPPLSLSLSFSSLFHFSRPLLAWLDHAYQSGKRFTDSDCYSDNENSTSLFARILLKSPPQWTDPSVLPIGNQAIVLFLFRPPHRHPCFPRWTFARTASSRFFVQIFPSVDFY